MDILVKDVTVSLGDSGDLKIPEWSCKSGDHILIRGQSGQGKTTFLHLLAGLLIPKTGQVTLAKTVINHISETQRGFVRRTLMGIIFQRLNLIDYMSVYENVALGFFPQTPDFKTVQKILEKIQMENKIETRASVLSLGEQQRVAVARAVIHKPILILADEPTSSLDDRNSDLVMQTLLESAQGKTMIVVSHDHRLEKYFKKIIDFSEVIA